MGFGSPLVIKGWQWWVGLEGPVAEVAAARFRQMQAHPIGKRQPGYQATCAGAVLAAQGAAWDRAAVPSGPCVDADFVRLNLVSMACRGIVSPFWNPISSGSSSSSRSSSSSSSSSALFSGIKLPCT